jgi:hypothetical protein
VEHVEVEVDVVQAQARDLRQAAAAVEQRADDRGVATYDERLALAGVQQRGQLVVGQQRHRLLRDLRRAHLGHRAGVDLALLLQPAEELPQRPVPRGGRRRGPAAEQVRQPRRCVRSVVSSDFGASTLTARSGTAFAR